MVRNLGRKIVVARYAERKGHSFAGFLILGLVISWVISLIVALLVTDKRVPPGRAEIAHSEPSGSRLNDLQKNTELRDAGTLSPDEFEAEKARILGQS